MKKITFILLLGLSLHYNVYSLGKGNFIIGGGISYQETGGDLLTTKQMTIAPTLQYLILPGMGVGVEVNYLKLTVENEKATQYSIGPKLTGFFEINDTGTLYASGTYLFGELKDSYKDQSFKLALGSMVFVRKNIGIFCEGYFAKILRDYDEANFTNKGNEMGIQFGMNLIID
jgi:hypothetical protein